MGKVNITGRCNSRQRGYLLWGVWCLYSCYFSCRNRKKM